MFNRTVTYKTPNASVYNPFMVMSEQCHLLIAGCTGSGKSVTVNGIIQTLLATQSPANCQFILIDPKRVELSQYRRFPHTLRYSCENDDIINSLQYAIDIMEYRYNMMQKAGFREYNGGHIYIIIDELADMMTTDKKHFLPLLQRILQLGRAARIHCIVSTQSVYVSILPGVLRCNIPVVIGLRTATAQQSRLLISATGCETLPDPKTTGTGYAIIRDGADLYKVRIHKYNDYMMQFLEQHWLTKKCIA